MINDDDTDMVFNMEAFAEHLETTATEAIRRCAEDMTNWAFVLAYHLHLSPSRAIGGISFEVINAIQDADHIWPDVRLTIANILEQRAHGGTL